MIRQPACVWVFLVASLLTIGTLGQTVPVYLPGYRDTDWEALRGSIITQDQSATAYTVFCAEAAPRCQIEGDIAFVFTEGPATLSYSGSASGEIIADLHCNLAGRTAATCTGSSSFGPNFHEGSVRGPTHTVWTSTFTGSQVAWGALTLTTPGPAPGTTDIDATAAATATDQDTDAGVPSAPAASGAGKTRWPAALGIMTAVLLVV
ncbi:hypothetical protein QBC47DRAFT_66369 [Echria macrotheca]|uniref:Uncharacterized protein n=1 Tax=Echria macrotheca TaxID=438768 RepID=A0AAJ0B5W8_9PEZI|nr:hypothetical protein QBC47DRAFT_66369 [Echria macrotheca]